MKYNYLNNVSLTNAIEQSVEQAISILADDIVSIMVSVEIDNIGHKLALNLISKNNSEIANRIDEILNRHRKMLIKEINQAFGLENSKEENIA